VVAGKSAAENGKAKHRVQRQVGFVSFPQSKLEEINSIADTSTLSFVNDPSAR